MYANGVKGLHRRLLIVLQGMDASGKGGIVRHVFSQGDPMGMHYHGFWRAKGEELDHDHLWRIKRELPNNGWTHLRPVPLRGHRHAAHLQNAAGRSVAGTVRRNQPI